MGYNSHLKFDRCDIAFVSEYMAYNLKIFAEEEETHVIKLVRTGFYFACSNDDAVLIGHQIADITGIDYISIDIECAGIGFYWELKKKRKNNGKK